jgi:tRNA(Arg) A34 adenosine deaminase TadA
MARTAAAPTPTSPATADLERMRDLAGWTHRLLGTPRQSPFASDVVDSKTGHRLIRRLNAVAAEHDPSSHAEVRALRAACKKLKRTNLAGYTLYTTCEPCPMCMAMALWAGVDRVVYGATIDDAARHCAQIYTYARDLVADSDLKCEVAGPVAQPECNAVFDDPRMQSAMKLWRKADPRRAPARR